MIVNENKKIEDLIKDAYEEKIWIPEFQRPFVWDNNQIRLLIDSLFYNYTISSILTWKGKNELARRRVGGAVFEISFPDINNSSNEIIYLLDGQQRTTALTYVFTDKKIYKKNKAREEKSINLYWDCEYCGNEVENRWIFDEEILFDSLNQKFTLKELEKSRELYKKFNARFIKIKHAYDRDWDKSIDENLFDDKIKYWEFKDKYKDKLRELEDRILRRKVVDIEQIGELNTVLDVFERINTKNTKLSIFDIMVAKTYKKYDKGYFDLRSYFKMITSEKTSKVDNNYFVNLEKIKDLSSSNIKFDEGTLLYLCLVAINKKFRVNSVFEIKTEEFEKELKNLNFILNRVVEIMKEDFYIEIEEQSKYQPVAKFLTAYISQFKKLEMETSYRNFISKWFWNTIIYNRYPGSQNEKIETDFKILLKNQNNLSQALSEMKSFNSRTFDYIKRKNLDNLFNCFYNKKSDQMYKMMLIILKSKNPKDFYSGASPFKSGTKILISEEHHIFPKNSKIGEEIKLKYENTHLSNIINNIANISILTKVTNNKYISNKNPSIYFSEFLAEKISQGVEKEFYQNLESHFIDKDMFNYLLNDDFENFILKRTFKIYEYLISLTNEENES